MPGTGERRYAEGEYGARGYFQTRGQLALREFLEVAQGEDFPQTGRQRPQPCHQSLPLGLCHREGFGVGGRIGVPFGIRRSRLPVAGGPVILGQVPGDAEQPGGEGIVWVVPVRVAHHPEPGLLGEILPVRRIRREPTEEGPHGPPVAAHELGEAVLLPLNHPGHEPGVRALR
jgi:hypothetical protein